MSQDRSSGIIGIGCIVRAISRVPAAACIWRWTVTTPLALLATLLLFATSCAADQERILYVAEHSGLCLYDIDDGHQFLRRIKLPKTSDYKGICVSPRLNRIYLSSNEGDRLVSVNLRDETMVWRNRYGRYPDSMHAPMATPACARRPPRLTARSDLTPRWIG